MYLAKNPKTFQGQTIVWYSADEYERAIEDVKKFEAIFKRWFRKDGTSKL